MRDIAVVMGRSPSTISRELRRGADGSGRYRPFEAHRRALARRRVHQPNHPALDDGLRAWVTARLLARWSPEQTARCLRHEFLDEPCRGLCAGTIHQAVCRPDLDGLPRELPGWVLRHRRRHRVPRRQAQSRRSAPVTGMTLIHQHPAEALDRLQPGHRAGDLFMGAASRTAIVTLVERTSRSTLLGRLPDGRHGSATMTDAVVLGEVILWRGSDGPDRATRRRTAGTGTSRPCDR